jgi:hypothetical protein
MIFVVLCSGPSLTKTYSPEMYAGQSTVVIGINRAVEVFPVDLWANADWPNYTLMDGDYLGMLLTHECHRELKQWCTEWEDGVERVTHMENLKSPYNYTIIGVLRWILEQQKQADVERVDIHGADCHGYQDASGATVGAHGNEYTKTRDKLRWGKERDGLRVLTGKHRGKLKFYSPVFNPNEELQHATTPATAGCATS